jgi:hypothetical protein
MAVKRHALVQIVQSVQAPTSFLPRDALIVTHNRYGWRLGAWAEWLGAKDDAV